MIEYNDDYESEIKDIIRSNQKNYIKVLKSRGFKGRCPDRKYLVDYIYACTPLLDDRVHTFKTRIYWTINRLTDFPECANDVGGKHKMTDVNVRKLSDGYPQYCDSKCQHEAPSYHEKTKHGVLDKYGVENAFQIESVKKDLALRQSEIQAKRDVTRRKNRDLKNKQNVTIDGKPGKNGNPIYEDRKRFAEEFFNKYGRYSFDQMRLNGFPYVNETYESAIYELNRLCSEQTKDQTPSRLIRSFHHSMMSCRRRGMLSPIDYWEKMKSEDYFESGNWKDFFINRFIYADTKAARIFRERGIMHPKMILDGLTITHRADCVSYLKPMLAKRLVSKYLAGCKEVFCPFNGFSGIMLGTAVGCGKKFIGRDLNAIQISESLELAEYVKSLGFHCDVELSVADVFDDTGKYETLFCCPPYEDLEMWNFSENGECIDKNMPCSVWIDLCLENFNCRKYLFVVDDNSIGKYAANIVETLKNRSHFGENLEHVILIER